MGSLTIVAGGQVYIDTQIVIYTVEPHALYGPVLMPLWVAVNAGSCVVVSSELSLMETLVVPLKIGDAVLVADYEQFFQKPSIRLEPITPDILRRAAQIRATTRLRTPDAIHAATALHFGLPFITNDKAFRGISGLNVQVLDDLLTP